MRKNLKIITVFIGCFLFRLLPLRAPNVEPLMASIMPISKKYGAIFSFFFGFLSIFLYDMVTHFGSWTWMVGITYGLVGVAAYFYFNKYESSITNFVIFSIFATLVFDLITGVLFAPMFGQTYFNALILQVPFTLLHLASNVGFALTISPIINFWLMKKSFFFSKEEMSLVFVK